MSNQWSRAPGPARASGVGRWASTTTQAAAWARRVDIARESDEATCVQYSPFQSPSFGKGDDCAASLSSDGATTPSVFSPLQSLHLFHIPPRSSSSFGHDSDGTSEQDSAPQRRMPKESSDETRRVAIKNTFYHVEEEGYDSDCQIQRSAARSISAPIPLAVVEILRAADDAEEEKEEGGGGAHVADGKPLPSVGSMHHGAGQCRPCAWFWKPGGCNNGTECNHCHLCPEDEIKRRRKAKYLAKRAEKRGKKSQDPQEKGTDGCDDRAAASDEDMSS